MEIFPNDDDDSEGYFEIIKHRFILSFESSWIFKSSWILQILEALDPFKSIECNAR